MCTGCGHACLVAAAARNFAFRLSIAVRSSALRDILCLIRCFLRSEMLHLYFVSQIMQ